MRERLTCQLPSESPRLSSFLLFLLSGIICYGVSCFTKWLPGADGRFARHRREVSLLDGAADAALNGPNAHQPKRPRRLSLPVLVLCIVLRLEIFHRVNYQQQCSTPGLEVCHPQLPQYPLKTDISTVLSLRPHLCI